LSSAVQRLNLSFEDWRSEIAPQIGGSILSLTHARRTVFRPTPEEAVEAGAVRRTACFPLVPYANRIAKGRFLWDGRAHRLAENFPASLHPLHGVGWRRPWQVASADERSCVLRIEHRPQGGEQQDWPFAFDAEQKISLGSGGLRVELSVINADESAAPLGLGLHPLFPRRGSERLIFNAAGAWRNGLDMLPLSRVSGGLWEHTAGQSIDAQALDNDFFGWSGTARIETECSDAIRITASPVFSSLRVFTPEDRDFFGIEPVSHSADAINRGAAAELLRVQPGARLSGTMTIDVDPS
jgi:aldose 1-epimerase